MESLATLIMDVQAGPAVPTSTLMLAAGSLAWVRMAGPSAQGPR